MTRLVDIHSFLAQKRIAMVGVSRNPKDFSRMLFAEFVKRGYDMTAVNSNGGEIDGHHCFSRIEEVVPAPDAVLLMTPESVSEEILRNCRNAGISHLWIYGYTGKSKISPILLAELRDAGICLVNGECPFMFFPKNGPHWFHGFFRKVIHSYPS